MILELAQHVQAFLHEHNIPAYKSFYEEMMSNKKKEEEKEAKENEKRQELQRKREEKRVRITANTRNRVRQEKMYTNLSWVNDNNNNNNNNNNNTDFLYYALSHPYGGGEGTKALIIFSCKVCGAAVRSIRPIPL